MNTSCKTCSVHLSDFSLWTSLEWLMCFKTSPHIHHEIHIQALLYFPTVWDSQTSQKARFKVSSDPCQYLAGAVERLKVRELKEKTDTIIPEAERDGAVTALAPQGKLVTPAVQRHLSVTYGFLQSRLSEIMSKTFNDAFPYWKDIYSCRDMFGQVIIWLLRGKSRTLNRIYYL